MARTPTLTIEGLQATVELPGTASRILSFRDPKALAIDHTSGQQFECAGKTSGQDGVRRISFMLPASLFDANEHRMTLRSSLWEGGIGFTLQPHDESGRPLSIGVAAASAATGKIYGRLEYFDGEIIRGWVYNKLDVSERLKVDVFVDNTRLATVVADDRRQELVRDKIGDGRCGFIKVMPASILDGGRHVITCVVAGSYQLLEDGVIDVDVAGLRKFVINEIMWRIRRVEALLE